MNRHDALSTGSALSRLLSAIVEQWKVLLVIAFFVSPIGPHLRWETSYREAYGYRIFTACTYLGSQGFITPDFVEGCPVVAWLDARPWVR